MKVLLLEDVYKLGRAGDVKKVAPGYARNYLMPQGLAVLATPGAVKQAGRIKKQGEIKRAYHRLARRYHPDTREGAAPTALFHQVQEAYAVLGDVDSRRAYDRQRKELGLSDDVALVWNFLLSREHLYAAYSRQMLYALIEIEPAATSESHRLPLNLCLVIDQSTSMKGARLQHVKEAARQIVSELQEEDALALVAFSDHAEVLLHLQGLGSDIRLLEEDSALVRLQQPGQHRQGRRLARAVGSEQTVDLAPADFDWRNPVARISLERVK